MKPIIVATTRDEAMNKLRSGVFRIDNGADQIVLVNHKEDTPGRRWNVYVVQQANKYVLRVFQNEPHKQAEYIGYISMNSGKFVEF